MVIEIFRTNPIAALMKRSTSHERGRDRMINHCPTSQTHVQCPGGLPGDQWPQDDVLFEDVLFDDVMFEDVIFADVPNRVSQPFRGMIGQWRLEHKDCQIPEHLLIYCHACGCLSQKIGAHCY